jgi:hypothetical protein
MEEHIWTRDKAANVLFAISSLTSIPHILPIACPMAIRNRTKVHIAFMGTHATAWENIRIRNGIDESGCPVHLHDARPDYASISSTPRLAVSARAALGHLSAALQQKAVMILDEEEPYFVEALQEKASSAGLALLRLPAEGLPSLSWIAHLDATALTLVSKVSLDIVIQPQLDASASVMRLLQSIKNADYAGWALPRLIIELPNAVDSFLTSYLKNFQWPKEKLVIRHRLDARLMTTVQASMRTVEAFYPFESSESHVLLLSPDVELSAHYFQFLMYATLRYKHSQEFPELSTRMMGISLDLPSHAPDRKNLAPYEGRESKRLTLWQAPTSTAALYFGDKWAELHTFLSYRLLLDSHLAQKSPNTPTFSHEYPAYLQAMFEMMQTQGFYMLYPTFMREEGSSALTSHRELTQSPEEYVIEILEKSADTEPLKINLKAGRPLTAEEELKSLTNAEQRAFPASLVAPLVEFMSNGLPNDSSPESEVHMFSFQGELQQMAFSWSIARKAAEAFAVSVGGCTKYDDEQGDMSVAGLFCLTGT